MSHNPMSARRWWLECREFLPYDDVDVVVAHKSCADGVTSACLFYIAAQCEIAFVDAGALYTDSLIAACKGQRVLVLDTAPADDAEYDKLEAAAKQLAVLDHHESNIQKFNARKNFFSTDESACMASMMYTEMDVYPTVRGVVERVNARDIWVWKGTDIDE